MNNNDNRGVEAAKAVLKALALGAVVIVAMGSPRAARELPKMLGKKSKLSDMQAGKALSYAKEKKWVEVRKKKGQLEVKLTKKGWQRWQKIYLDQPLPRRRWDGKWRIVMFDIPVSKKNVRDGLRFSLKRLGFLPLQRSVWVSPYPCEAEARAIAEFYTVQPHVVIIEANRFEGDKKFLNKFKI